MAQEIIIWNNKKYIRNVSEKRPQSLYFYRREQKDLKRKAYFLHREVWEFHNGKIKKGFHIHHIDGDVSNNSIKNLEMINPKDHIAKHPYSKEKLEKQKKHLEKIRPKAIAWHSTKEGIETNTRISREFRDSPKGKGFHKKIAKLSYKNFVPIIKKCAFCGDDFHTARHDHIDKFCSRTCTTKNRKKSGIDNEIRICEICGKKFEINKYQKRKRCSRNCKK